MIIDRRKKEQEIREARRPYSSGGELAHLDRFSGESWWYLTGYADRLGSIHSANYAGASSAQKGAYDDGWADAHFDFFEGDSVT